MVNDSSLAGGASNFAFDVESQSGVMQLLASIRASEISSEQKNELRDLVFLYTNGGRDQSVRISLEQKIASYGVTPIAPVVLSAEAEQTTVPEVVVPAHPFGTSRPAPTITTAAKPAAPAPTPAAPEPVSVSQPTPIPEPKTTLEVKPAPTPTPAPEPTPTPETKPAEPASKPAPEATPEVKPTPAPAPAAEPEPTPAPAPATPPPAAYDPNASLQRIREIKSLVNEKVGNPVNLVDINNEVGREYMSALLDAMKKLNSGTSVTSAMSRLEAAYQSVEKTLEDHEKNPPAPEAAPEVKPTPAPAPVTEPPAPTPSPVPTPQAAPVPMPEPPPAPPKPAPISTPPPQPAPAPSPEPVLVRPITPPPVAPQPPAPPVRPEPPAPRPVVPAGAPAPIPAKNNLVTEIESAWGPATDTIKPATAAAARTAPTPAVTANAMPGKAASLAQSGQRLRTPNELADPASLETSSVAGDPLFTKEVDDGLQQLLTEWPLFKKSGLFGTGAKGREHPLFKKIAGLQIPLLLAGRFEGASQEIKQSITDYMNGWRYEQGIIYEQGETFEHYLRRVIRHILDLQKKL